MSFFEELRDPAEPGRQRQPEWAGPTLGELPVPLPLELVAGRSDRGAVLLGPLRVYASGVEIELTLLMRDRRDLGFADPLHLRHGGRKEDVLRLALVCSDGSSAEAATGGPGRDRTGRRLAPQGGGGGDGRWAHRMWFWPLPTPGAIEVVCLWPSVGIEETRTSFDARPILDAAARVERLWEDEGGSGDSSSHSTSYLF